MITSRDTKSVASLSILTDKVQSDIQQNLFIASVTHWGDGASFYGRVRVTVDVT